MTEAGLAPAPETAVDEVVVTARRALHAAPPLGAPEYLAFAGAVAEGAGRRGAGGTATRGLRGAGAGAGARTAVRGAGSANRRGGWSVPAGRAEVVGKTAGTQCGAVRPRPDRKTRSAPPGTPARSATSPAA